MFLKKLTKQPMKAANARINKRYKEGKREKA